MGRDRSRAGGGFRRRGARPSSSSGDVAAGRLRALASALRRRGSGRAACAGAGGPRARRALCRAAASARADRMVPRARARPARRARGGGRGRARPALGGGCDATAQRAWNRPPTERSGLAAAAPMIAGIRVGHATDPVGLTGVTVVLSDAPAVAGIALRGGANDVVGLDHLDVRHLVATVDGVALGGGSRFGEEAIYGVMRRLAEASVGLRARRAAI